MRRPIHHYALAVLTLFALTLVAARPLFADITIMGTTARPDLIVSQAHQYQVGLSSTRYGAATIKNIGNGNSAACKLRFRINMPIDTYGNTTVVYIKFVDIPALSPGQEHTTNGISLGGYTYKNCGFDFMIDKDKIVTEKDEGNNYNLYIFP